ncbi:MAG: hypothetical protein H6739_40880 [Alphaproteobacteria bacterium]|nr:hypothetical protein [Alphaproteobacteria bacterium]
MRFPTVDRGETLRARLKFWFMGVITRSRAPDVIRTMEHRPKLLGKPFQAALQVSLRGPSVWSVGHRELMAAYTSKQNRCPF